MYIEPYPEMYTRADACRALIYPPLIARKARRCYNMYGIIIMEVCA